MPMPKEGRDGERSGKHYEWIDGESVLVDDDEKPAGFDASTIDYDVPEGKKRCFRCRKLNDDDAKYCQGCGNRVY